MTTVKITVSVEAEVVAMAREAVAAGRARSVSAWFNAAGRAHSSREDAADVLAEILESAGGPMTEAEKRWADERLAVGDLAPASAVA